MNSSRDQFLYGILIGIGVLVIGALILFFIRRGQVTYGNDTTPAGALQNYFLAVQRRDYQRAYDYLVEGAGKPAYSSFQQQFLTHQNDLINNTAVEVGKVTMDELTQQAFVEVTLITSSGDLFGSSYSRQETAVMVRQNGAWKVQQAPYPYDVVEPAPAPPKELPSPTPASTKTLP